jgi:hypothetical protein
MLYSTFKRGATKRLALKLVTPGKTFFVSARTERELLEWKDAILAQICKHAGVSD